MRNKYFHKYLKVAPFALALWRSLEAQNIEDSYRVVSKSLKFNRPVLDIGCGFGEFAGVFFDKKVEVGVDIDIADLIRAKKINKYKTLITADARNLPFPDHKFATVLSVSVLEHMSQPEKAIKEAYRVLKPGGLFIYTVPTLEVNRHLFYPELFKKMGLTSWSSWYIRKFHQFFKHVCVYPAKRWWEMTKAAGFTLIHRQGIVSDKLVKVFDLALISALPSQITRWLIGSRCVWGLPLKQVILDGVFTKLTDTTNNTDSNILIIAQKP